MILACTSLVTGTSWSESLPVALQSYARGEERHLSPRGSPWGPYLLAEKWWPPMLLWQGGELYGNAGLSEVSGVLGSRNNTNVLELQAVLLALKQFLSSRKACPGRNSQHISGLPGRPPGEHKVQTILEADPTAVVVGVSSMHLPRQCICQAFKTRPRICYPGSTHLLGNGGCIHKWWKQPGRDRARQGWISSPHSRRRTVPSGFLGGNL